MTDVDIHMIFSKFGKVEDGNMQLGLYLFDKVNVM
jgi:hypothetical protein